MKKNFILVLVILLTFAFGIWGAKNMTMEFLFKASQYARDIESEGYLMSEQTLGEYLKTNSISRDRLETFKDLYGKNISLVVRLRNVGGRGAWGTLKCKVQYYKDNYYDVKIIIPFLQPMQPVSNFIISMNGSGIDSNPMKSEVVPDVSVKWDRLYAK